MLQQLTGIVIMICTSVLAMGGQVPDSISSQRKDTTLYDFIIAETKYQHQFTFWGRNYGNRLPFSTASLVYYSHSQIYIGVSGFHFFDEAIPDQLGLSAGIYREPSSTTTWSASYTQFFMPGGNVPAASRTQGYLQSTFGIDWGLLYSTLQAQLLINKNPDVFLTTNHSRYFQFNQKLWNKIRLSFEPKLSFTFGTNRFEYGSTGPVIGPGGGAANPPAAGENGEAGKKVKLLNWDFLFPMKMEWGNFSIEPSWRYTVPENIVAGDSSAATHIFMISLSYYWPIAKQRKV